MATLLKVLTNLADIKSAGVLHFASELRRAVSLPRQAVGAQGGAVRSLASALAGSVSHAKFEVLLYDLTSTYFDSDPPQDDADKRRHGYSRDKRSDCVQVVIALIVTPEGLPLAYEVLPGNTADNATLRGFLEKIEAQYGKAQRIWVMDRGIPTEDVLREMRQANPPISYLVGTPKGRLTNMEKALLARRRRERSRSCPCPQIVRESETLTGSRSAGRRSGPSGRPRD